MRLSPHSRSSITRYPVGIALDAVCLRSASCAGSNPAGDAAHGATPPGMDTDATDGESVDPGEDSPKVGASSQIVVESDAIRRRVVKDTIRRHVVKGP